MWRLNDFIAHRDWLHNRIVRLLNNMHVIKSNLHIFLPPDARIVEYPFVHEAIGTSPGRILDVGCYSKLPIEFASLGFDTYGIDLRAYPFSHPSFRFVQGDIAHTSFQENFFDTITAVSVIEHVGVTMPKSRKALLNADVMAMKEIKRILKPKGKLILSVPFGKSRRIVAEAERIYDSASLSLLLEGFATESSRLYAFGDGAWGPIELNNIKEGDRCLALIVAYNVKP